MATPAARNLSIYQGDDYDHVINFTRLGEPYEVEGTFKAQIRPSRGSATLLAEFAIDTTEQPNGTIVLSLTHTQTAALPKKAEWDLQLTDVDGRVRTLMSGTVLSDREVTVPAA